MIPQLSAGRAPIEFGTVRGSFHGVRAVTAAVIGVVAVLFAVIGSATYAIPYAVGSVIVFADALYQRTRGDSAAFSLFIDITVIGSAMAVGGASPSVQVAALAYGIAGISLLLPARQTGILMIYALGWAAVIMAMNGSGLISATDRGAFDGFLTIVLLIDIAALMSGATRNLLRAQDRQQKLLDQERRSVEVKNEFVSMVSHELRTPITGITGFSETLREHWRDLPPSEVDEFLTILRGESNHLANLVEDILVIPRLDAGQLRFHLEQVGVSGIAESVAEMVLDKSTTAEVDLPVYVKVWSDPVRLRQILRNLVENARKYGGDELHIYGEERREGTYTVIVADNGAGIPEADQERIFEHFEQLSKGDARLEQGVGLGLPIARKLARAMGGDLWYEDRFPVGAAFCFDLDMVKDVEEPSTLGAVEVEVGADR
ncbi:MAG: HAMP domain-containing sensor histidine kinase [Actinomycetota bacterium]|nr:HAMP domain-containing sensor histidine kinase [Actinomycetota bacterium]